MGQVGRLLDQEVEVNEEFGRLLMKKDHGSMWFSCAQMVKLVASLMAWRKKWGELGGKIKKMP